MSDETIMWMAGPFFPDHHNRRGHCHAIPIPGVVVEVSQHSSVDDLWRAEVHIELRDGPHEEIYARTRSTCEKAKASILSMIDALRRLASAARSESEPATSARKTQCEYRYDDGERCSRDARWLYSNVAFDLKELRCDEHKPKPAEQDCCDVFVEIAGRQSGER
jgi:hypothetical protein